MPLIATLAKNMSPLALPFLVSGRTQAQIAELVNQQARTDRENQLDES